MALDEITRLRRTVVELRARVAKLEQAITAYRDAPVESDAPGNAGEMYWRMIALLPDAATVDEGGA